MRIIMNRVSTLENKVQDLKGLRSEVELLFTVQSDIAQLLLDVTDNCTLGRRGEGVVTFGQDLHQIVGQIETSQTQTQEGVGRA